jgi:hydrogenase nickel incorporation protein HypA/HybF
MHELTLLSDLLAKVESVAQETNAKRIARIKVRIGALAHISADHFRGHFITGARGTAAEDAELDIEVGTDITEPHAQDIMLQSVEVVED